MCVVHDVEVLLLMKFRRGGFKRDVSGSTPPRYVESKVGGCTLGGGGFCSSRGETRPLSVKNQCVFLA